MCKLASDDIKTSSLLEIFRKFTKDQSKWVKQAATQYLGPFLVSFKGLKENQTLLDFYVGMVTENFEK